MNLQRSTELCAHPARRKKRNAVDNIQAEPVQGRNVCRCIGQQANVPNTEVAQDLTAEPDLQGIARAASGRRPSEPVFAT